MRTTQTPKLEVEVLGRVEALQVLIVLHMKWVLRKVACSEYSTNYYTHITHNESMHCL